MSHEPTPRSSLATRQLAYAGIAGLALAIVIVAGGMTVRAADEHKVEAWTESQAIPTVSVIVPKAGTSGNTLDLPGRLEAFTSAPIYARVDGYLKSWHVDIGDRVKAGDELAVINTPELDQQSNQAKADLASAQAEAALAKTTAERWQALLGSDSVSRQDVDDRTQDYAAKKARVLAAQANVDRLVAEKSFARIVAPFDGVITARNTDVGALINAGSGSAAQLFTVASVDKLRVYVHVPQDYAPLIKTGESATFDAPQYPGKHFTARVVALADQVNAESGTTVVQLMVDNPNHLLIPGSYVSLQFALPVHVGTLRVPASALIFDARGLRVASVDGHDRVRFKSVSIQQDYGNAVAIGSGLTGADRVIDTPPDGLVEGDLVRVNSGGKGGAHG